MTDFREQDLDARLAGDFLNVPEDFAARVMDASLAAGQAGMREPGGRPPGVRHRLWVAARWVGVLGGGALAFGELLAFMFGLWSATHAF